MSNKSLLSIGGLAAAIVLFVAINMVAGAGLRSARVDLTENHLYTLSQGSRAIAAKVAEPITLTLYYSERLAADLSPQIQSYGTRVKEVLREYASASKGKITLKIISPEPFSDDEDKAVQNNLAGVPVGRGTAGASDQRFYFGLVGSNSTDHTETIPFFRPDREEFLEYELTRMIYLLSDPPKKSIGLMSWLPIDGGGPNPMTRQAAQPWQIYTQLKELFDVKKIPTDAAEIPADIQVLLVVHPKNISEKAQYAIDQFVLKGGRAIVFVDPLCTADVPPGINPMQAMQIPKDSKLPKLFDAWGIEMIDGQIAADRTNAIRIQGGSRERPEIINHVLYLGLNAKDKDIDPSDPITGQLDSVNVVFAGVLQPKKDATTTFTPLITTSVDAMTVPASMVQFSDPKKLLADFVSGNKRLTIAARISGKPKSAFTGPPAATPDPAKPDEPPAPAPTAPFVAQAAEPINVVVVADCDFLSNQLWVNDQLAQMGLISKFADNGDFVIGAADNLSGSSDLMSVRARGKFARPFDKVNQIQRDAQQKFLAEEQSLETKLRETEQKITDLQRKRPDQAGAGSAVLLTPEQATEIENFRKEQVDTRKKLREVKHQLNKDIERLDHSLTFLNVGFMPLLVGLLALSLSAWRVRRRRLDRTSTKALS